ncbi:cysteine proteinase inhibitor 8-like [Zingiber officinale]|uniref:Cystatin domain-containing protein n=1 Tax=Zingiber officinale TaxID=94328 RepID=A0A8J5C269_ZINOF|nr:cysteine proteinase inhibitor 8-like [Zingiber officinale]KAG6470828.1 hypothetical protein ZIOFF_071908 [Zingiber officinale]
MPRTHFLAFPLNPHPNQPFQSQSHQRFSTMRPSVLLRTICLLPLLLAFFAGGVAAARAPASSRGPLVGGWTPIANVNDAHVQELAAFAVSEHNKTQNDGSRLTLVRVVKAEQQVVAGTNYRLDLSVKDANGAAASYQAVVWEKPWQNFRQLTSFVRLSKT